MDPARYSFDTNLQISTIAKLSMQFSFMLNLITSDFMPYVSVLNFDQTYQVAEVEEIPVNYFLIGR